MTSCCYFGELENYFRGHVLSGSQQLQSCGYLKFGNDLYVTEFVVISILKQQSLNNSAVECQLSRLVMARRCVSNQNH
jgi:hypothetical protein